jgi:hypothetical protein
MRSFVANALAPPMLTAHEKELHLVPTFQTTQTEAQVMQYGKLYSAKTAERTCCSEGEGTLGR